MRDLPGVKRVLRLRAVTGRPSAAIPTFLALTEWDMRHATKGSLEPREHADGVVLTHLLASDDVSLQRVQFDPGTGVEEHSHHQEQLGFVFSGTQTIVTPDETVHVAAGESYAIDPHEPHAVENRGDEPLEAVSCFSPPRQHAPWEHEDGDREA